MKFSIIVPVYNVASFLPKCLDSALNQTFEDYEIIAVNDGSTDDSRQILSQYQKKSSKIRVIDQSNKGLGGARNTGIQHATGEFLFFLDSDDYIPSNALEEINNYLQNYNLDLLAFDCNMVDASGRILQASTVNEYSDEFTILSRKQFILLEPTACLKVYRRSLYIKYSIFFPEHLWYEDLATVFKLVPHADHLGYLKKRLYNYVQHPTSITHSRNTKRMLEIIPAFESFLTYFHQQNLFDEYYDELEWNCILHVLYYSAFRFLDYEYDYKDMDTLYKFCNNTFPTWKSNKYLKQRAKGKYLMNLIVQHQFFQFYLKTGFVIRFINPVWAKARGLLHGNKKANS